MNSDVVTEHRIFWMLVQKGQRRDDVGRVYLAIQAAVAHERASVDVGSLMGAMMPAGQPTMSADYPGIGAGGLAYFHWLYEVELLSAGDDDLHEYRLQRRHDGAQLTASLKTAPAPRSLHFQQEHARELRRLAVRRAQLLDRGRW